MSIYDDSVYQKPLTGRDSYYVRHFYDASFEPNWHSETELIYLPAGSKPITIYVNHQPVCIKERMLYIVESGCLHSGLESEEVPHFLFIEFGFGLLGADYLSFTEQRFVTPYICFSETDDPRLLETERLLIEIFQSIPMGYWESIPYITRMKLRSLILQVIVGLITALPLKAEKTEHNKRLHSILSIQTAIQYINEHYDQQILLDDIARISGYEKKHFSTLFKEATGFTFYQYLIHIRMEIACQLLRDTGMPISSIAALVGIRYVKNFSRTFRNVFHMSPGEYREINRPTK